LGALRGKYTTKEIHDEIMGYNGLMQNLQDNPMWMNILNPVESSARYVATILNIKRGLANIPSSFFDQMANGMFPINKNYVTSMWDYYRNYIGGAGDKAMEERIYKAMRLGVIDKDADVYTLKHLINNSAKYVKRGPLHFLESFEELTQKNPQLGAVERNLNKLGDWAAKFHGGANAVGKMAQWERMVGVFRDAYAEAKKKDPSLPAKTEDDFEVEAARTVRDNNISYSLASHHLKTARRVPLVGTFLTFFNEMLRSRAMQIITAKNFIYSGNDVLRNEGLRRMAGIMASWAIPGAVMATSMKMNNVSWDDDTKFRKLLPPWEQSNALLYGPEIDGKRFYMNMNYIMPHGDIARGILQAIKPHQGGVLGNAFDALGEVMHPMYNFGLIPGALMDTARNQTEFGTQVYNPQDTPMNILGDVAQHVWQRWAGGTFGRVGRKILYPLTTGQYVTRGGAYYDPLLGAVGELGLDVNAISIPDRFRANLWSNHNDFTNAQRIFTAPIQRTGNLLDDNKLSSLYDHSETVRRVVFQNLREMIEAARSSGMSTRDIRSALKERQYSRGLIDDLMTGRYFPYVPGKGVLQRAKDVGNQIPGSFFSSRAKSYEEAEPEQ
jgi:hypothetical protein